MRGLFLLGFTIASVAFAGGGDDSCDDHFARHYKADLVPFSLRVTNVSDDLGQSQIAEVRVKNIGFLTLQGEPVASALGHSLLMTVLVNGAKEEGWMNAPLAPGAIGLLRVRLPPNYLTNCSRVPVHIDFLRNSNQFGCRVFANDATDLQVRVKGAPACGHISPIPFPIP